MQSRSHRPQPYLFISRFSETDHAQTISIEYKKGADVAPLTCFGRCEVLLLLSPKKQKLPWSDQGNTDSFATADLGWVFTTVRLVPQKAAKQAVQVAQLVSSDAKEVLFRLPRIKLSSTKAVTWLRKKNIHTRTQPGTPKRPGDTPPPNSILRLSFPHSQE